jgi:CBS domain containing-hemolysin-like protein
MSPDSPLPTRGLAPATALAHVQDWPIGQVTLDAPALAVMTDLTRVKAASTSPSTSLRDAEQFMIYQGVRMLFVVRAMPMVDGLVTVSDLHGDTQMRLVQQRNVRYDDLTVADVMTPLSRLDAIDHAVMVNATVANVVATFRRLGRNHLLVAEGGGDVPVRVRGVISRTQVERQLGFPIAMTEVANTFPDVVQMLA